MDLTKHLEELGDCLTSDVYDKLLEVVEILKEAKKTGKTVYTFGNGGSHSTASHFACDLLKACGIKAICVSDMVPSVYAYNNDIDKQAMFEEPLNILADGNPLIVGFSCSGNSGNVVEVFTWADATKILFTGEDGGHAAELSTITIKVYNDNIRIQESAHLAYCHAIVEELLNDEV